MTETTIQINQTTVTANITENPVNVSVSPMAISLSVAAPQPINLSLASTPIYISLPSEGGGEAPVGDFIEQEFTTVLKNLKSFNDTIAYDAEDRVSSKTYSNGVVATYAYTGDNLTSITLSGSTPSGIALTRTLVYDGSGRLINNTYS